MQTSAHPTTVSLVLGGGARGLAHIGVIHWLNDNGYDIRSIAGSSMGALVEGIYAASKLEIYAEWVLALERLQVVRLLDPAFGRTGLFKGERIMGVLRPVPPPSTPMVNGNAYRQRIRAFIESLHPARTPDAPTRGFIDIAFVAMQAMQDTIARLKLAAYSPDVTVEIPRNACGFHEFWRAEELIALGRERAAQAFATTGR